MNLLPRIVQFGTQLAGAWYLVPPIKGLAPSILPAPPNDILVDAFLYAAIVMIIGHAGALILKEIRPPSGATLVTVFVLAFLFAGLTLIPQISQTIEQVVPLLRTNRTIYPLVGALAGYLLKR